MTRPIQFSALLRGLAQLVAALNRLLEREDGRHP